MASFFDMGKCEIISYLVEGTDDEDTVISHATRALDPEEIDDRESHVATINTDHSPRPVGPEVVMVDLALN